MNTRHDTVHGTWMKTAVSLPQLYSMGGLVGGCISSRSYAIVAMGKASYTTRCTYHTVQYLQSHSHSHDNPHIFQIPPLPTRLFHDQALCLQIPHCGWCIVSFIVGVQRGCTPSLPYNQQSSPQAAQAPSYPPIEPATWDKVDKEKNGRGSYEIPYYWLQVPQSHRSQLQYSTEKLDGRMMIFQHGCSQSQQAD